MKPLYSICIAAAGACLVVFAFINADSAAEQNNILAELFGGMALMVAGYTLYLLRDRRSYDGTIMHRHHHHHRHRHRTEKHTRENNHTPGRHDNEQPVTSFPFSEMPMKKKFTIEIETVWDTEEVIPVIQKIDVVAEDEDNAPRPSEAEITLIAAAVVLGKSLIGDKEEFKKILSEGVDYFWDGYEKENPGVPGKSVDLMDLYRHDKMPRA